MALTLWCIDLGQLIRLLISFPSVYLCLKMKKPPMAFKPKGEKGSLSCLIGMVRDKFSAVKGFLGHLRFSYIARR